MMESVSFLYTGAKWFLPLEKIYLLDATCSGTCVHTKFIYQSKVRYRRRHTCSLVYRGAHESSDGFTWVKSQSNSIPATGHDRDGRGQGRDAAQGGAEAWGSRWVLWIPRVVCFALHDVIDDGFVSSVTLWSRSGTKWAFDYTGTPFMGVSPSSTYRGSASYYAGAAALWLQVTDRFPC